MLEQIAAIVKTHMPDLFLLCGDIYHTAQPSSAVQTMLTEALVKIHKANPDMTMVITAGNHDSASRHEIFKTPWSMFGIHTIGCLDKENPDGHIIELPGKGFVIAVPYANERNIPDGFFQQLLDRTAERNTDGLPVVMSAHTAVRGCDLYGHDMATDITVGGIDSLDISSLGEGYDYLALGHIHHAQFVHTGKHNARYSGTPIPISFDENYPHSVSMVEIARHGETPNIKEITIDNPRPLVTIPAGEPTSWEEAKKLLDSFDVNIPAYIRLNVEIESFLPTNANYEASAIAEKKNCRFCYIRTVRKQKDTKEAGQLSLQEFREGNPMDIARRYADDIGVEFNDEMFELFNEAMEDILDDSQNNRQP